MRKYIIFYKNINGQRIGIDIYAASFEAAEKELYIRRGPDIKVILSIWKLQ